MADDTVRGDRVQAHLDALKLEGVPELFLDLWGLWKNEMTLRSPAKATAIEEAIKHVQRELAIHGIV